jgi:hypothetical protein
MRVAMRVAMRVTAARARVRSNAGRFGPIVKARASRARQARAAPVAQRSLAWSNSMTGWLQRLMPQLDPGWPVDDFWPTVVSNYRHEAGIFLS